jgi:Cof subfamily protein (haloacid dehalogenase superfamily)
MGRNSFWPSVMDEGMTDVTALNTERSRMTAMVVADLDGTLLHDGATFEERFLTQRSIDSINRLHDAGVRFMVETARPVSTGLRFVDRLPVDAVAYLNGALIDFNPAVSDYEMLTSGILPEDGHLMKIGFSSQRACEVCRYLLEELPGLEVGIVMDDVRYTNFDVTKYWKTQTWRYTDFNDVPEGVADKLILFPNPEQWNRVRELIPADFDVHISEGTLWMLMSPDANKEHALTILADHFSAPLSQTVSFGDDLVDISMLQQSGRGVAVANANPDVLKIADEICPSNNDDGVAQWIERHLL